MTDPKPSLLEVLLGRTVEIELPGKSGRRKVSKKWFDRMVATGQIEPTHRDTEPLVSNAKLLVRVARIGPVGLFVPLLDRFPGLAKAKPEDWDFFLGVGSAFAGIAQHEFQNSSRAQQEIVRGVVAEELLKWQPDAVEALKDCENFVVRSMEALLEGVEDGRLQALSRSLGIWLFWNVLRRKPEAANELELASVIGALALKIVEGCWEPSKENAYPGS